MDKILARGPNGAFFHPSIYPVSSISNININDDECLAEIR